MNTVNIALDPSTVSASALRTAPRPSTRTSASMLPLAAPGSAGSATRSDTIATAPRPAMPKKAARQPMVSPTHVASGTPPMVAIVRPRNMPATAPARFSGGLVASGLTLVVGEAAMGQWGWRVMVLLGPAVVPVGLVIRRHLPETAGAGKDAEAAESTLGVMRRLFREHGRLLALTFVVISASTVSNAVGTNMPVYAKSTLGLTETVSTAVPIALGLASVLFPLLGGVLADRAGRRPVMVWPRALVALLAVPAFLWLVREPSAVTVYAVTFLLSALSSVNAAAIIVAIPESLPRAVRSAGLSIVYALAVSVFGGSTNYVVNKLVAVSGDKLMPAYYLAAFSVLGTVAAWMMPETRGRDLDAG